MKRKTDKEMLAIIEKAPDGWYQAKNDRDRTVCMRLWRNDLVRREARGPRKAWHFKLRKDNQ